MESKSRIRIPDLLEMKRNGRKITMLTAYDATMARLLDNAGIDVLLVGDSLGMVVLGEDSTLGVTLEMMVHHTRAVVKGTRQALVVADMPFLSFQSSMRDAVRNAGKLMQQGGAAAVKLEGGAAAAGAIRRLTDCGIPVMGHIGLVPQSVHQLGGFRPVGRTGAEADALLRDAEAVEGAGAFALVLESMPAKLAGRITEERSIPTIGIGAGVECDGQVLVSYDAFGFFDAFVPRFVKRYAELGTEVTEAARRYIDEVRRGEFPAREHSILTESGA
ncbi:MAG: 3-methyl-2-oxobutanoate hydroxymethyltransferase [Acidobacteria bacterium]|nr:3-methyl-2-oxobutanoate hydroxymethyltransferase [Acidobacteriota bacterium]